MCAAFGMSDPAVYFFAAAWTVVVVALYRCYRTVGHRFDPFVEGSMKAAAGWRAVATLAVLAWLGSDFQDARKEVILPFIDLPSRALFAGAFLALRSRAADLSAS